MESKIRVKHFPMLHYFGRSSSCRDFWGGWLDDELSCKKAMEKLGNSARTKEIQKYTEYQSENHKLHLFSSHFSAIPLNPWKHVTPWSSNSTAHHRASGATLGRTSWSPKSRLLRDAIDLQHEISICFCRYTVSICKFHVLWNSIDNLPTSNLIQGNIVWRRRMTWTFSLRINPEI